MTSSESLPLFCPAQPGFEALLQRELWTLGIKPLREEGGFFFHGTWRDLFRTNLCLRTANRVLVRIQSFEALQFSDLEKGAKNLSWARWVARGQTFYLRVTCKKSKLYHEGAVEERLANWIEQATGATFLGPAEKQDTVRSDSQLFVVRIVNDRCTVSADTSGDPLSRRGYRQALAKAPLRESTASAMLHFSGWVPAQKEGAGRGEAYRFKAPAFPLIDPFCGSGTIPIEAALIARKIPPGMANVDRRPRDFSFLRWNDHDENSWLKTIESLGNHIVEHSPLKIVGSDRDAGAIESAQSNAERAGVASDIDFEQQAFSSASFPNDAFVITNPPYGIRVSETSDLRDLYASFGKIIGERLDLRVAWLCASEDWKHATRLTWGSLVAFSNGGIEVRLLEREVRPSIFDRAQN